MMQDFTFLFQYLHVTLICNVPVALQAKLAQETVERLQSPNPDEKRNALSTLSNISEVCHQT